MSQSGPHVASDAAPPGPGPDGVVDLRSIEPTAAQLERAVSRPGVRRVLLDVWNWPDDLAPLARLVPSPIEVGLRRVAEARLGALESIAGRLVALDVMVSSSWSARSTEVIAQAPRLERLDLRAASWPTVRVGSEMVTALGRLQALHTLSLAHWVVEPGELDALVGALGALRELAVIGCGLKAPEAKVLGRHRQLARLNLEFNKLRDTAAQPLAALPALARLELGFNKDLADKAMAPLAATKLEDLGLRQTKVTADGIRALADGAVAQTLVKLSLEPNSYPVDNDEMARQIGRLPALREVHLLSGYLLSEGARGLAALPRLERLEIHGAHVDEQAGAILAACDPRVRIGFNGCRFASPAARAPLDARAERLGHSVY